MARGGLGYTSAPGVPARGDPSVSVGLGCTREKTDIWEGWAGKGGGNGFMGMEVWNFHSGTRKVLEAHHWECMECH